ncbi:hypothetical protein [Rickettsiella massiliensis]|uniref:hypothetical protein n=1 Tax=Rickettsiella massiliensis TaxID=676517 RepID=UPI00178C7A76|nr:hypothetical protein [Rickettsiella massiliensis]
MNKSTSTRYSIFNLQKEKSIMKIEESIQKIESLIVLIPTSEEKEKLKQKLSNLKLISILMDDIKEVKKYLKNEDFYCYFKDFQDLRTLLFYSEKIYPKNVEWFLNSDLFYFMLLAPEKFKINLKDVYQKLINSVKFTKKIFLNINLC